MCDDNPVNLLPVLLPSKAKFASITNRVMNASAKQVRQGRYADSVEVRVNVIVFQTSIMVSGIWQPHQRWKH
jgi:hypothetical protein